MRINGGLMQTKWSVLFTSMFTGITLIGIDSTKMQFLHTGLYDPVLGANIGLFWNMGIILQLYIS